MCHHSGYHEHLIASLVARGHIIHLDLRLQLCKQRFLCAASIVVVQHLFRINLLIGDDDLEVVAVVIGNEQVQLHRFLVL